MPFDSPEPINGYVELHRVMTAAREWFGDGEKWIRHQDFLFSEDNKQVTAACARGAMILAAGIDWKTDFRFRETFSTKYEPYFRAATGHDFGDLIGSNDRARSFDTVMQVFDGYTKQVERAIANGLTEGLADLERDRMAEEEKARKTLKMKAINLPNTVCFYAPLKTSYMVDDLEVTAVDLAITPPKSIFDNIKEHVHIG